MSTPASKTPSKSPLRSSQAVNLGGQLASPESSFAFPVSPLPTPLREQSVEETTFDLNDLPFAVKFGRSLETDQDRGKFYGRIFESFDFGRSPAKPILPSPGIWSPPPGRPANGLEVLSDLDPVLNSSMESAFFRLLRLLRASASEEILEEQSRVAYAALERLVGAGADESELEMAEPYDEEYRAFDRSPPEGYGAAGDDDLIESDTEEDEEAESQEGSAVVYEEQSSSPADPLEQSFDEEDTPEYEDDGQHSLLTPVLYQDEYPPEPLRLSLDEGQDGGDTLVTLTRSLAARCEEDLEAAEAAIKSLTSYLASLVADPTVLVVDKSHDILQYLKTFLEFDDALLERAANILLQYGEEEVGDAQPHLQQHIGNLLYDRIVEDQIRSGGLYISQDGSESEE